MAEHLHWHFEPTVVVGLALFVGAYFACVGPLRRRFAGSAPVSPGRQVTFVAGALMLVIALISPLDGAAEEYLFSAHMLQHLVLTLAAAPLLLLGTPGWLVRRPAASGAGRFLTAPVAALVLFNGVYWAWHWPALYDLALEQPAIHALEHLMFLATAVLAWWPICGPLPEVNRLSYPLQLLYLFFTMVVCSVLGALITFQGEPAYSFYAEAPRLWGLSRLDDQRIGGLMMWVGTSIYYLVVIAAVFVVWARREEREETALALTSPTSPR